MNKIIEANLFLAAGLMMVLSLCQGSQTVITFLIAVVFTESAICIDDDRVQIALLAVYVLVCLWNRDLIFFLPVLMYQNSWRGRYKRNVIAALIFLLFNRNGVSNVLIAGLGTCSVIAVMMAYEASSAGREKIKALEAVDTAKVMENELKSKNNELLENQYASIHIAMLQERNRIAREIHDNVGHMLSRTILQMGALMTIHKEEPLHGQLESVNDSLNEAMNNIRESIHDLHDESIDLRLAIQDAVSDMTKKYEVRVEYDMSDNVPRNVKYCFIAIVKEAMSNIVKHSNADKLGVLVREHPGFYQMIIEDNGTAKDSKVLNGNAGGIGLKNMADRVAGLSGTISISDEKGFKIMISVPKAEINEENMT